MRRCVWAARRSQGSQFPSEDYLGRLERAGVRSSMDGKGRFLDDIMVERLWRTVKYEDIYLHEYATVSDARAGLSRYFPLYNEERIHEALGYLTPAQVYRQGMVPGMAC